MISFKRARATTNYWKCALAQQRENATPVDPQALLTEVRSTHPRIDGLLADLERDGVASIEGFWSADKCAAARSELDRMMQEFPQAVRRFSNGADRRMFGVESGGSACREFYNDIFLRSIGELATGFRIYNFATLGARIEASAENMGSGEGWHRDSFGRQFKTIIYLCDVDSDNGPYEYVLGSHKAHNVAWGAALGCYPAPPESRIQQDRMDRFIGRGWLKPKRFEAKAGTVIFSNTAGVHRGQPLRSGHRYALTNYYYYPYQIGESLLSKFEPFVPGATERLARFLETNR